MANITVIEGDSTTVEVQIGASWVRLPGASAWSESGGEAPSRDIVAFGGSTTRTGVPRAQQIELEVSAYVPQHRSWKLINEAARDGTAINIRMTTPLEVLSSGAGGSGEPTFAVSSNGLTIANPGALDPTVAPYGDGMVLQIDPSSNANGYVISGAAKSGSSFTATAVAILAAATSVTVPSNGNGQPYRFLVPSMRRGPVSCRVLGHDNASVNAEGELTARFTLQASGILPQWLPVIPTT